MPIRTKQEIELKHLEMARRVSQIIPAGPIVPSDKPDLRIRTADGVLGVEHTWLVNQPRMGERGLKRKILGLAKERYKKRGGREVNVEVFFSLVEPPQEWRVLSERLATFVVEHFAELTPNGRAYPLGVLSSTGFQHINIRPTVSGPSEWRVLGESGRPYMLHYEDVECVIADKNEKLRNYQPMPWGTWLLMVVDPFPRAAYACLPDNLGLWRFVSDFRKVLLFSREEGRVIELLNQPASRELRPCRI